MASDRIEDLRKTQFATARRGGYDRDAVDTYLSGLADWLETDEAKATLAQREIGRVGERTGAILGAAQESADETIAEARIEADALRAAAQRETSEQRTEADSYAKETRSKADADAESARKAAEADAASAREVAETDAARTRDEADEHARLTIREADSRLERASREAEEKTASIDTEIAELAVKRDQIVANLEELVGGIRAAIDGPGSEDLGLPERSRTAAAFAEPQPPPEPVEAIVEPLAEDDPDYAAESPTRVEVFDEQALVDADGGESKPDRGNEPAATRPYVPDFDADDELYDDARPPEPLPSGSDPDRGSRPRTQPRREDPTTDEQKLTELL